MKFTELEYVIITRALRIASEQYGKDADAALPTSPKLARNFTDSQITARALAERIEEEERRLMAAGILPRPGTKVGPCASRCEHIDCKETRERAASKCLYCRKPVGFGVRVYQHGDYTVHARCHEEAAENSAAMF